MTHAFQSLRSAALAALAASILLHGPAKADRLPPRSPSATSQAQGAPAALIGEGYARLRTDLDRRFWDASRGNPDGQPRIRPTDGSGGPRNGLVDNSKTTPTFWQMAQYLRFLYEDWRATGSADSKRKIALQWADLQRDFPHGALGTDGRTDSHVLLSDDAGWVARSLMLIHEVTGDPEALDELAGMIPATLKRFKPPQREVASGPLPFSPHGMLYDADSKSLQRSSLYEANLAIAALYVADHTGETAFRDYAAATLGWMRQDLKVTAANNTTSTTAPQVANGIYWEEEILAGPDAHHPNNRHYGPPLRGFSAQGIGGTMTVANLAARLASSLKDEGQRGAALAEARAITAAMLQPHAFVRTVHDRVTFVDDRDPWTDAYDVGDFVRNVLTLPGNTAAASWTIALINTAAAIMAHRTADGLYLADWAGAEINPLRVDTYAAQSRITGNKGGPGGQAAPDQIMTAAQQGLMAAATLQARHLATRP